MPVNKALKARSCVTLVLYVWSSCTEDK